MKKNKILTLALLLMPVVSVAQDAAVEGSATDTDVEVQQTPETVPINLEAREYSESEVGLLQELEKRKVELDRREKAIELRERLVDLAHNRLDEKVDNLNRLQKEMKELLSNLSDKEEKELEQLASIYEKMKPAAAASVLDRLDNNIVFDLFKRMKQKNTAKIMEKMSTAKARVISEMLAEKEDLPAFN